MSRYDAGWVRSHYDAYGENEWNRWDASPTEEAKLHVHREILARFVRAGDRVLEVGPGPGRFTAQLSDIGAEVVDVDISPVQLDLHRRYAEEKGFAGAVKARHLLDVCNMEPLPDGSFDVAVAFGGPLSYVFERRDLAAAEVRRVLRPGGLFLSSVMSLWGTVHEFLGDVLNVPLGENQAITRTGDLHPETFAASTHHCHLFRAAEFRAFLEGAGFTVLALSASNCITAAYGDRLAEARQDPARWAEVLRMEVEASAEPGCLDLGTHLIGVARKR